jgi:signal transduction histidine kinase
MTPNLAPMTLRRRVALASTLLGFLLSVLFCWAVIWVTEEYEHGLAAEILQSQADDYSLRLSNHLIADLPKTHRLSGYFDSAADMPPAYKTLPLGMHEDASQNSTLIGVFNTSAGRLVFTIDLSDIEELEQLLNLFLAGMVVLGTALAGWLGWWFAGLSLLPVRMLVDKVDALPVQPRRTQLARDHSPDELGRLALSIDAYQARLFDADAREQAFFADASHELRTPLTVVQGVTEVMLDDAGDNPAHLSRLRRLERGVRDMANLIEALLGVARRSALQAEPVDARDFLSEASHMALPDKAMRVVIDASGSLVVPRREAQLLVAGLMRKVAEHSLGAELHLRLDEHALLIEKRVDGIRIGDDGEGFRSDVGRGSALLERLAERLGWHVDFETPTRISIHLHA